MFPDRPLLAQQRHEELAQRFPTDNPVAKLLGMRCAARAARHTRGSSAFYLCDAAVRTAAARASRRTTGHGVRPPLTRTLHVPRLR